MGRSFRLLLAASEWFAATGLWAHASDDFPPIRINYLAYPVEWDGKQIIIGARFQEPLKTNGKLPAVIILHGTVGVRYVGTYYATALNGAGIATLEIDQWGGRGLPGGASSRPKHLGDNLPDVAGAYHLLATRPRHRRDPSGIDGQFHGWDRDYVDDDTT